MTNPRTLLPQYAFAAVLAVFSIGPGVPLHAQEAVAMADPVAIAQDAPRHALVIGNSGYKIASPLKNPAADADLMAETLGKIGFTVTKVTDAGYVDFNRAVVQYANSLPDGAISVVYYAGHGVQVSGQNFLLPVDADPASQADLPFLSMSLDNLLGIFRERNAAANIFILDACRNNPFEDDAVRSVVGSQTRGLAPVLSGFRGSMIAFSTAPGKVAQDGTGRNSPYSIALADAMLRPGLPIESVFKLARTQVIGVTDYQQVPWENSSLTQEIYLAAPAAVAAAVDPQKRVTQCDLMAGHPSDPERVHVGVDYALLRPGPAIAACRADLVADPHNPRLMSLLARALTKNGELQEALALDEAAVKLGYLGAYHNLGNHYRRGEIVKRDLVKALELFTYAAERGHPEDAYNVGILYRDGEGGVPQDFSRAHEWFEKAAQQDYPSAFDKLGLMAKSGEGEKADAEKAAALFARGAELGDSSAMVNLASAYRKGEGVQQDFDQAFGLYRRAAQLRRTSAYTSLGDIYLKGQGREVDMTEALFWFQLAARQGHGYSQEKAAEISAGLDAATLAEVERRVQNWINGDFG
ncbi:caspase family protein [Pseudotabrizicola sp.]|uniref:caspase family protein n=1 Tax=Pseudotabrizicola sp. TaxID=2939647 RepID=UPI00271F685D|nr:caspase family protein [Pseudotabrizicola sp.]MDO8881800.1 caspase family protein [Pseudotabrizicola sp.]